MLAAIEAGLILETETGDGYNIAPFLRFWEMFSPALEKALKKSNNVGEVLNKKGKH